ncbi:Protein FIZZY-RELATED 2 [Sesbania bispinosa]|nr:Protein FIZZY-RELATED 2 [Sesbania bispinosa]
MGLAEAVCEGGYGGRGTELWRSRNKLHTLSWNASRHNNVREKKRGMMREGAWCPLGDC